MIVKVKVSMGKNKYFSVADIKQEKTRGIKNLLLKKYR